MGSWEILASNQVLVGILHVDTTSVAWAIGLRNLIIPGKEEHRTFYPIMPIAGMPYDMGRNVACMKALELGASHLFFYDSDVVAPKDTILRLMAHNVPLISGMYCRRSPPHGVPVMIRNGVWVTDFPMGSVVEVDMVGAGCLLIRRDVLEKLPPHRPGKHWFDWRVDMQGILPKEQCLSEDFTFCNSVRQKLGIPILVDTSIQCRHLGFAQATYGNLQPCEVAV